MERQISFTSSVFNGQQCRSHTQEDAKTHLPGRALSIVSF